MQNNIIQPKNIKQTNAFLGAKTLNLKKCLDWGFNVPNFIAIPSYASDELYSDDSLKKELIKQATATLDCAKYVIRSSALIEDGNDSSFAGQFMTKINLSKDELISGLTEVLGQAYSFLSKDLSKFSLIIQEYIAADISGVAFTRSPNGQREMMLEYGFCEGEKIVSGEIKPEQKIFYWNEQNIRLPKQLSNNRIINKFKKLELKNNFPQDIEWCIQKNEFYILQTRPITTISNTQYKQIIFIEEQLPQAGKYFFGKTELSEIAPRPTDFTLSLLNLIYAKDGPVNKVYKKYGVNFYYTDFLQIIGNELFVDKEKELQGLLPSHSYLQNKNFSPQLKNFSKLFSSIKNLFSLNRIKTSNYKQLLHKLKLKLAQPAKKQNVQKSLDTFLATYSLIFEINLLSGLAIKKLDFLLKKEPVQLPDILNEHSFFTNLKKYELTPPKNLTGNSLEVSDETVFTASKKIKEVTHNASIWWSNISPTKKKMFENKIIEAIIYNQLRELGRWLTIKNINSLRAALLSIANSNNFKNPSTIYFTTVNKILNTDLSESDCQQRKILYAQYDKYTLPNTITSSHSQQQAEITGVSAGIAQGILQTKDHLERQEAAQKIILYTQTLSPDLTKYFSQINGIVSENGGVLSHLAIMARENNIPVVVGFLPTKNIQLGDTIQINGSTGVIKSSSTSTSLKK